MLFSMSHAFGYLGSQDSPDYKSMDNQRMLRQKEIISNYSTKREDRSQ